MLKIVTAVLLLVFCVNVVVGAVTEIRLLSDILEMIVLLAASIFFVGVILKEERESQTEDDQ